MKTKFNYPFSFSKELLLEHYTSKEFYTERMKSEGIEDAKIVSYENSDAGMSLEMKREVEIRTDNAPKFVQKVVDKFISGHAAISTYVFWDKKTAIGSMEIDSGGMPGEVEIKFNIIETGENSSEMQGELKFRVNIPVVGKRLEKFALPKIEKVIIKDFDKAREYFESL